MGCQPTLCPANNLKQPGIGIGARELSAALLCPDPRQRCLAVAVDSGVVVALVVEQRQCMHDGQALTDVVGGIGKRPLMEHLGARRHIDTTIFHHPGITRAGTVHGNAVVNNLRNRIIVDELARSTGDGTQDVHLARIVAERLDRLLLGVERLVAGTGIAIDTQLAFCPRVTDARFGPLPHDIPLAPIICHE